MSGGKGETLTLSFSIKQISRMQESENVLFSISYVFTWYFNKVSIIYEVFMNLWLWYLPQSLQSVCLSVAVAGTQTLTWLTSLTDKIGHHKGQHHHNICFYSLHPFLYNICKHCVFNVWIENYENRYLVWFHMIRHVIRSYNQTC